jgi:hypothetical protein
VSTVHEMFASSDEQEMTALVREVDELRRARGLQQLGPWWQIQRSALFGPRRLALEIAAAGGPEAEVAMEACWGWYWAADVIAETGARLHLAHPCGTTTGAPTTWSPVS